MKYAWIQDHLDSFRPSNMCKVLKVSRSGYYAWKKRKPSSQAQRRKQIAKAVEESHNASKGTYGHRRIHTDVTEDDQIQCCKETVRQVMKDLGIQGKHKKAYVVTTDSNHADPIAPNRLKRDFSSTAPNQKWLGDITYIRTMKGWLYLAVILDCFSRKIVGWAMSPNIDAALVCDALNMAIFHRCPNDKVICHSDRGKQYASKSMRKIIKKHRFQMSMSRKGDPWDNAMMESFFGKLKTEWADVIYKNHEEAKTDVFKYIETFYNPIRRHSSLGNVSPIEYERRYETGKPTEKAA